MAKQVIAESPSDDERLTNIFRRCTTRPAAADELAMLKSFLQKQREQVEGEALWAAVSRAALMPTKPSRVHEHLQHHRRHFFQDCGIGTGKIALASLLAESAYGSSKSPNVAAAPHSQPKAKAVIHMFMAGAPSQLELFDNKPLLTKLRASRSALDPSVGSVMRSSGRMRRFWGRASSLPEHRQSGLELSEMLPHLATVVDDIAIIKSCRTTQFNHAPAQIFMNTGFSQPGRPSMGSWITYGLGSESRDLPSFVVMSTGSGISGGAACGSGGLCRASIPAHASVTRPEHTILNVDTHRGSNLARSHTIDLINAMNHRRLNWMATARRRHESPACQMAYRQSSAPELMDLASSRQRVEMYGCDPKVPSFARACLLARRMVNSVVSASSISTTKVGMRTATSRATLLATTAENTDQASAALIKDLKQRGMLDDTLVVWGGEFGRTPMVEASVSLGRSMGRDHHPQAFEQHVDGR